MSSIRVKNAAPIDDVSLCRTCSYVHMQKGFRESEELIFCTFGCYDAPRLVPFKVRECTDYTDRDTPSREELEKLALLVQPKDRPGFRPDRRESDLRSSNPIVK